MRYGTTKRYEVRYVEAPATPVAQPPAAPRSDDDLSPRQREVLNLTAKGMDVQEIAEHLDIGISTVKTHRYMIRKILGADVYRRAVFRCA